MAEKKNYELFISYAEADRAWVEGYLLDALQEAEIKYTCESAFALGVPRISEFERAIQQSQATLLVISEAYLADGLTGFTDILAQSYGEQVGTWPVIPLTLQTGLQLSPRLKMLTGLEADDSKKQQDAIKRLCGRFKRPLPAATAKPACPYLGMIPFSEHDEERFFGRDEEIEELLGKLRLNSFLTIIGASGSGKSSLVFAGLIPQLKQSGLFGTGQWCVRSLRPGTSPLANLQAVLGGDIAALEVTIGQLLSIQPDARRLLLVVDQFEELFTQAGAEATTFQETLLRLADINNVYLILTVRADFYPDLMGSPLWEKIHSRRFEVLPLNEQGLRQAIVRPAEGTEVFIESALVERLVVDAKGEPGVLPLVQETLVLLWEKLERRFLPLSAYELLVLPRPAYGGTQTKSRTGLQVAIARRADAALADLREDQEKIARRIFLRLIQFGEGRPDTRRQQLEADLRSCEEDSQLFDATLEHLASGNRRLLIFSGEEGSENRKVDIAHEALIFGWQQFQQWLAQLRKAEKTRRRLQEKAQEWIRLDKKGGLLDEIELPEARNWLSSNEAKVLGYDKSLEDLIVTSWEKIEAAKRQKEEQQERELKLIKKNLKAEEEAKKLAEDKFEAEQEAKKSAEDKLKTEKQTNRILVVSSTTLLLLFIFAGFQWRNAQIGQIRALSESSKALLSSNNELYALKEAIRAGQKLNKSWFWLPKSTNSLVLETLQQSLYKVKEYNRLERHMDAVKAVDFSPPDGEIIATASNDSTVKLSTKDGKFIQELKHHDAVNEISFSPNGKILASAGEDGIIKLWKRDDKQYDSTPIQTLKGHTKTVRDISFSPDGKILASASRDGTIKLWKCDDKQCNSPNTLKKFNGQNIGAQSTVVFSPNKQIIASGSENGTIRFWTRDGNPIKSLNNGDGEVYKLAFSPNEETIASVSDDKTIKLWKWNGNSKPEVLKGHNDVVMGVSFSPDGKIIASASQDRTIKLWRQDGTFLNTLLGHDGRIYNLSFNPKTKELASASDDKTVRLWKLSGSPLKTLSGYSSSIRDVTFSNNGKMIASAGDDKTVKLWDRDGTLLKNLDGCKKTVDNKCQGHFDVVYSVAFDPNNQRIVSGGGEGQLKLWKVNGTFIKNLEGKVQSGYAHGKSVPVYAVTFSPDGQIIVSGGADGILKFWDARGKLLKKRKEHTKAIRGISFSRDNQTIASASWDGTIKLWKRDGTLLTSLPRDKDNAKVHAVAFSPDKQKLVSGGDEGKVKLWKWDGTKATPLNNLKGHQGVVYAVAFSPDGKIIATASENKIKLWEQDGTFIKDLVGHHGKVLRISFSPDSETIASASDDKVVIMWDWNLNLDINQLLSYSCNWIQDYLDYNLKEDDDNLCAGIEKVDE